MFTTHYKIFGFSKLRVSFLILNLVYVQVSNDFLCDALKSTGFEQPAQNMLIPWQQGISFISNRGIWSPLLALMKQQVNLLAFK